MSIISGLIEMIILGIMSLDTIGLISYMRKSSSDPDVRDYTRMCFTWIFYFAINALTCSHKGFFGSLIALISLLAKVYISIPLFHGTMKLYHLFIERNLAVVYIQKMWEMISGKCEFCTKEKKSE